LEINFFDSNSADTDIIVFEGSMTSTGACTKRVKLGVGLVNSRKNFFGLDN
jgi:hypothetical protein